MKNVAIFASGTGSNAENIIKYFKNSKKVRIKLVLSNNFSAKVLQKADSLGIPSLCFSSEELNDKNGVLSELKKRNIDFIILAGFLKLIPAHIIENFPRAIINIHPAILPSYGGKGMYGMKVHEAVVAAREVSSGITIHYVNENFDEGTIIFQAYCDVLPEDSAQVLADKIHDLEMINFPKVIESLF